MLDLDEDDKCNDCRYNEAKAELNPPHEKKNVGGYKSFKPGVSGNPAGRPKGSKNRTPAEMRDQMRKIFNDHLPKLYDDLERMKPFFRWTILTKLLQYCMPPMKADEETLEEAGKMLIQVRYGAGIVDDDINTPPPNIQVIGDDLYDEDGEPLDPDDKEGYVDFEETKDGDI